MVPSISHRIHRSFDSALSISWAESAQTEYLLNQCLTSTPQEPSAKHSRKTPCSAVGQIPIFRGTKRHCSVLAPPSDAPQGPRLTVLLLTHLVLNHSLPNGPWLIHPIVGMLIMGFENYINLYWIDDHDDHPPI